MLHYFDGTVFNAPAKTIVNTVNCSGVMGAGLALEFKLRYPFMFDDYEKKCENKEVKLGRPYIYEYSDQISIMNFPTKGHWRFPSKIQWIEDGLMYFASNYERRDIRSIAFPKLGCSNGGLKWEEVKPLMEKYLKDLNIDVYICLDEKQQPEGIELSMVEDINHSTIESLTGEIKLTAKQAKSVLENLPVNRFRKIERLEGVGEKSYSKLFSYFYHQALKKQDIDSGEKSKDNISSDCVQVSFDINSILDNTR